MAHEDIPVADFSGSSKPCKNSDKLNQRIKELSRQLDILTPQRDKEVATRKELQAALAERETKFRIIANFSWDREYWIAPEGNFLHISPSCQRITGYIDEEFYNNPDLLFSIIHPDDRKLVHLHLQKEIRDKEGLQFDFRILTKNGEERWISHTCRCVENEFGQFFGRRVNNRDITWRKKIQQTLQEGEKLFRMVLDATSNGVWDRNLQTGDVYYGENWAKMLGYTHDELRDEGIPWEDLLHPDDKFITVAAVLSHVKGITPRYVAEFRMRNREGQWWWVLARGKVVEWDRENRPLRFVGTHCDISDRKKIENELKASSKKIKEFAYSVIHDLKNPAITIHGLAAQLQGKCHHLLDERGKRYCTQILDSAQEIASLVEKINVFISAQQVPHVL